MLTAGVVARLLPTLWVLRVLQAAFLKDPLAISIRDVTQPCPGHRRRAGVAQATVLCAFDFCSDACLSLLSKTGGKACEKGTVTPTLQMGNGGSAR